MSTERVMIYKRFERFWHWSQAFLVIGMMITGFEIHGTYTWLGFGKAVYWHTQIAYVLLTLWAFAIVWQFTTGEWRQYLPGLRNVDAVIRYYVYGIFVGKAHPFHKTVHQKHNPLQRLAYLAFLALMGPMIWGSGLFYMFYNDWPKIGLDAYLSLEFVAFVHVVGAFAITLFFFVHVYLTATGPTLMSHIKSMITGYDEH